tara:strand:- start:54 stop:317 length:264 start_codon:yes stop_codon:yes gene_type:complete
MPKYSYKCSGCNNIITIYHSISDKKINCNMCETTNSLERIPSKFLFFKEEEENNKIGSLVKQSIEESKEELDQEKQRLKNELFIPDE